MMDQDEAALVAEQLTHTVDLLRAGLDALQTQQTHDRELTGQRLTALECGSADHEARLRTIGENVTQLKVWSGLASSSSNVLSLVALLRAWLGG